MRIAGYLPIADQGFAVPAFQPSAHGGNAWYCAIPQIEGDQQAPIGAFDFWQGTDPCPFDHKILVEVGDPWQDVFLWQDLTLSGTPPQIFERLKPHHKTLRDELPLSFLELSLAARAEKTAEVAELARELLCRRLGDQDGAEAFCDSVVRAGVLLEIRRAHHRVLPDEILYGSPVDFVIRPSKSRQFEVELGATALDGLASAQDLRELRASIARFGDTIGVGINLLESAEPPPLATKTSLPDIPVPEPFRGELGDFQRPGTRSRLFGLAREMAIDLGTGNTRVYIRGRGVVLNEPSIIALKRLGAHRRVLAVGDEAKLAIGRAPPDVDVVQPLQDGIINDFEATVAMLEHFLQLVGGKRRRFSRPIDMLISAPSGASSFERQNIRNAAIEAGASEVWVTEAPLAAAVGAGLPVSEPIGTMLVHIGSGATDVAILSLRNLAYSSSIRVGGDKMDEAIVSYIRRHFNLLIGRRTAETIRLGHGAIRVIGEGTELIVRGRDVVNGVPKEIAIASGRIAEAIAEAAAMIIEGVRIALENCAPELAADIIDTGITLTGGGALLPGMDETIRDETGLPVTIAVDPQNSVTRGLARMLEDPLWRAALGMT